MQRRAIVEMAEPGTARALDGVRIVDLTRILAGPTCTQLLGDLGADVLKIEKPGEGDDTRKWGPPYVEGPDGPTAESAYYLASNRNKRSIAVDIADPRGQALVRRLVATADVVIENFKVGGLVRYGLDHASLLRDFPRLVYCSITGFGQTGPYAPRAGYDYLAQGYGGIMSITGQPDGPPTKVGVGIADIMCGMYATVAILAALRHRDRTGLGQHIDACLLDTQVAWLTNEGVNYLLSGRVPRRLGDEHPNIVPYKMFESADGYVLLAAGNDGQWRRWCAFAGAADLAAEPRFATNSQRVAHRQEVYARMKPYMAARTTAAWVEGLEGLGVPCGPVNDLAQVFADPQVVARGMRLDLPHATARAGTVPLIANPLKMSATPPAYRRSPPTIGEHTDEVLGELLGLDEAARAGLRAEGVIG
jgi:crotonobetainyl-CoA:carnitine CoA-transferase CaiB-like acyl-CoA transferase